MKFTVTLDRDEDGVWIVECPAIPGCISQGQTKQEAIENIKDASSSAWRYEPSGAFRSRRTVENMF